MTFTYPQLTLHLTNIVIALAIGLLVGSERGWQGRGLDEGGRVAGIRTFPLIALLGGIIAVATSHLEEFQRWLILSLVFLPMVALLTTGYVIASRAEGRFSLTTSVSALLVYWLGALPAFGLALPAAAISVVIALLLHAKDTMHHWLQVLDESELLGTLQFLLVSVVILPLLPNRGFGPWGAINPYHLWWLVVLISGLSLLGYFAMRIVGSRKGITAMSLTGGLVSSTAVTLNLSRLHREVGGTNTIASGILLACATMFARMLVVVTFINKSLLLPLTVPLGLGTFSLLIASWLYWRKDRVSNDAPEADVPPVHNPFQLIPALQFAGLLALVMLGVDGLQLWFGDSGLYLLSVLTGIADVDAIVLSLAPKSGDSVLQAVAVLSICLAAASNTLMKGIYCRVIAGPGLGWRVLRPMIFTTSLVLASAAISFMISP